jgi:hypothetical protein
VGEHSHLAVYLLVAIQLVSPTHELWSRALTIQAEVPIEAWLANARYESTEAVPIPKSPERHDHTNTDVIVGKLRHVCDPLGAMLLCLDRCLRTAQPLSTDLYILT